MAQPSKTPTTLTPEQEKVATEIWGAKRYTGPEPGAVAHDSRICFGITFFATAEAADAYAAKVRAAGTTYNGGWFHGMACGRDTGWDVTRDGKTLFFAVTD